MYSSVQGGRFIWPYEADRTQRGYGSRPPPTVRQEPVNADTLGGRNMPLSGQAQTALAFDVFALFVSLLAILYASFFKQPPGQWIGKGFSVIFPRLTIREMMCLVVEEVILHSWAKSMFP